MPANTNLFPKMVISDINTTCCANCVGVVPWTLYLANNMGMFTLRVNGLPPLSGQVGTGEANGWIVHSSGPPPWTATLNCPRPVAQGGPPYWSLTYSWNPGGLPPGTPGPSLTVQATTPGCGPTQAFPAPPGTAPNPFGGAPYTTPNFGPSTTSP